MPDLRTCKHLVLLAPALLWTMPVCAQVEQVAVLTSGISCGVCAAVSEVNFRRMPGVEKVSISLSKEAIFLTYKPGVAFDPRGIREVLRPLDVRVVQFQISARGQIRDQGGRRLLITGRDRFALTGASGSTPPPGSNALVQGIVNDRIDPMEIKVLGLWPTKHAGKEKP